MGSKSIPVEFGARGFPAPSVHHLLSVLGVKGKQRKIIVKNISEAAERASKWLSIKCGDVNWLKQLDDTWKLITSMKLPCGVCIGLKARNTH